jgi:hypothetical protein
LILWAAALAKGGSPEDIPWKNADDMYATIDLIQVGHVPWITHTFQYSGPRPNGTCPQWMDETYELSVCDVLLLLEKQLATPDFNGHFNTFPFTEFTPEGHRVWSNLMSGDWAYKEAVRSFAQAWITF